MGFAQPASRHTAIPRELTPKNTIILCGRTEELRRIGEALETTSYSLLFYSDPTGLCDGDGPPRSCIIILEQPQLHSLLKQNPRFCTNGFLVLLMVREESALPRPAALLCEGVAGFLEYGCSQAVLLKALERLQAGELWVSRKLASETLRRLASMDDRFTRRENEILRRISAGQDNRQIAQELFITHDTVRWHLRRAYTKLGVHDRRVASRFLESEEGPVGAQSAPPTNHPS